MSPKPNRSEKKKSLKAQKKAQKAQKRSSQKYIEYAAAKRGLLANSTVHPVYYNEIPSNNTVFIEWSDGEISNFPKSDADIKLTLKLPPVPAKLPLVVQPVKTSTSVLQVPVIELERLESSQLSSQPKMPTISEEEELLESEEEMDTDQVGEGEHTYAVENVIVDNSVSVPLLNQSDPLNLNLNSDNNFDSAAATKIDLGSNKITVEAQVHTVDDQTATNSSVDYETATQEEKDRMVYEHIQSQNREIDLLKNTVTKLLNEKKAILKQQTETICDINLLTERLRVAESAEEIEVIKDRLRELQKQNVILKNISKNYEKNGNNENFVSKTKTFEKPIHDEILYSATSSSSLSSEDEESDFERPRTFQKRTENRIASKMRFLMREEFQKILDEQTAKKRAQEEDEASKNKDGEKRSRTSGPTASNATAFIEKENPKLKYTLERSKTNIKTWKQMLMTELSLKRYGDILDSSIEPPFVFTASQKRERSNIVKGIILSHIDECYQEQVIDIESPIEIMEKLEKLKRDEINETSASITDQLNKMRYEINKEPFVEFYRKFEEVVRKYELVAGEKLGEKIKTDALYRAVVHSVPSLQTATYTDRARGSQGFNLNEIKKYVQQHESENKPASLQLKQMGLNVIYAADGRITCTKCGMIGHTAVRCKTRDGYFKCFECHKITDHKAAQCPDRRGNQGNQPKPNVHSRLGPSNRQYQNRNYNKTYQNQY